MNAKVIIGLILGGMILILSACSAPPPTSAPAVQEAAEAPAMQEAAPMPADLNEPNDTCQEATSLALDEETAGILDSAGDTDMYQVEVEPDTPVVVTLTLRHPEPEPFEFLASTQCKVDGVALSAPGGVVDSITPQGVADYYGDDVVYHTPASDDRTAEEAIVTFNLKSETGFVYLAVEGKPEFSSEVPYNLQVHVELSENAPTDVPSR